MKTKSGILILLLVISTVLSIASIAPVQAADSIDIAQSSVSLQGNVSQTVSTQITVLNTGNTTLNIGFSSTVLTDGTNTISLNSINGIIGLANGSSANTTVSASIPSTQFASTYTGTITATGGSSTDTASVTVAVNPSPLFTVSSASATAVKGAQGKTTVSISNTGNTNLAGTVTFEDLLSGSNVIPGSTISANQTSLSIAYRASGAVEITVNVPSSQPNGIYTGKVNFTGSGSASGMVSSGILTVIVTEPVKSISVQNANATFVRGISSSVQARFNVTSTSNVNLPSVTVAIPSQSIAQVSLQPTSFSLSQNQSTAVTVTVSLVSASPGIYSIPITTTFDSTTVSSTFFLTIKDPTTDISVPSEIIPGGSDVSRGATVSTTFTITNTGETTISNLPLTHTIPSTYNPSLSPSTITLLPGQSAQITLTVSVPTTQASGKSQIGIIQLQSSGTSQLSKTIPVFLSAESKLRITDIDVSVDGETKDIDRGDSKKFNLIGKNSISFDVEVKNNFASSDNIEIRDVEITVTIRDIDDGDDLDESSSEFDVREDKRTRKTLTIELPDEIDSDDFSVDVEASGRDENGVSHSDRFSFSIDVERKDNDVRITDVSLNPVQVNCGSSANLAIRITNYGRDDEDNVILEVKSSLLDRDILEEFRVEQDSDNEDNHVRRNYLISVRNNFASGTYPITVSIYKSRISSGNLLDQEQKTLSVSCQSAGTTGTGTPTGTTSGTSGQQTGQGQQTPADSSVQVVYDFSSRGPPAVAVSRGISENAYIALLLLGIAFLTGFLVWMLSMLRK